MNKKKISYLSTLIMILSLAGCASHDSTSSTTTTTSEETTSAVQPVTTEQTTVQR